MNSAQQGCKSVLAAELLRTGCGHGDVRLVLAQSITRNLFLSCRNRLVPQQGDISEAVICFWSNCRSAKAHWFSSTPSPGSPGAGSRPGRTFWHWMKAPCPALCVRTADHLRGGPALSHVLSCVTAADMGYKNGGDLCDCFTDTTRKAGPCWYYWDKPQHQYGTGESSCERRL